MAPKLKPSDVTTCADALGLVKVQVDPEGPEAVKRCITTADTVRLADCEAVAPAALLLVTVQVAVPALLVPTVMLPLVLEPVAVAPAPEQLTVAELAFAVVQVNVLLPPTATVVGLKEALVTLGAAYAVCVALRVACAPPAP